jgi:hypothetical protein
MYIRFLVEDNSGAKLLSLLLPRILGPQGEPHYWHINSYKGVGHIPKNLTGQGDSRKTTLLGKLPALLKGFAKTPGIEAVVVVLDADKNDCRKFLAELKFVAAQCAPALKVLFRLAIEEIEAWYLGDRPALKKAFPHLKNKALSGYVQDELEPIGTWELLAEAVYPGGMKKIKNTGWPLQGELKHEWAGKIGPFMSLEKNSSSSFRNFRDGLRRLISTA